MNEISQLTREEMIAVIQHLAKRIEYEAAFEGCVAQADVVLKDAIKAVRDDS